MRMMWKSNPIRYVRRAHALIIQLNAYWHAADVGERSTSVNHMNCLYHIDMGVICFFAFDFFYPICVLFLLFFCFPWLSSICFWLIWIGTHILLTVRRDVISAVCILRVRRGAFNRINWSSQTIWWNRCLYYGWFQWKSINYKRRYAKEMWL